MAALAVAPFVRELPAVANTLWVGPRAFEGLEAWLPSTVAGRQEALTIMFSEGNISKSTYLRLAERA